MRLFLSIIAAASMVLAQTNGTDWVVQIKNKPMLDTRFYNFRAQPPGGTLTASVPATITLKPCPPGVNGTDVLHPLYISGGTGTAEAATISGGTCTSGASTGTVQLTPGQNHSGAWTIQSATSGIRECFIDAAKNAISGNSLGACYTAPGTWNLRATLYNDQLVSWFGSGPTTVIQKQFTGDGIVSGPATFMVANQISLHDLRCIYAVGGYESTSGAGCWVFRNIADGEVSGLEALNANEGFRFAGSLRVKYSNLYSNSTKYAYHWNSISQSLNNAGQVANFYGSVQANGTAAFIEANVSGLALTNFLLEAGSASNSIGLVLNPSTGNVINELEVSNGNVDAFTALGLGNNYLATTSQSTGSTLHFSNIRVTLSSANSACVFQAPFVGIKVDNLTCFNAGTGDALTLSGIKASNFTAIHADVGAAGGRTLVLQAATGAEVNQNLSITGSLFGFNGTTPTNAVATDTAIHDHIRFAGNKFNGGISGFANVTNTFFDRSNEGLPINSIAASAGTLAFPPFPDVTVSSTTGVSTVSGLTKGAEGTLITPNAGFTFTAGATIGNSCTVVTNKLYIWQFDGIKIWMAGNGC